MKYTMSLNLNVLNHLGINLYSNIPAVLSEIVANSWDADAKEVIISINDNEITILDDGCGMTENDINDHFLKVGYQKRETQKVSAKFKRPFMGRKGIGKLSMFSIAKEIDVISAKKASSGKLEISAFRMNVDTITDVISRNSDESYHPEELNIAEYSDMKEGTLIVLKQLKKNISSLTSEYIRKRIARRFGIIGKDFNFSVKVNGSEVSVADRDYFNKLNYIWYYGEESKKYAEYAKNATSKTRQKNEVNCNRKTYKISGWIGTVESSGDLKDGEENLNKITILVRGKVGQEDILADYSEGGLYSKYLIGEINADFFDSDEFEDMATSSRQEYKRDDERYVALKEFIKTELKDIQSKWTSLRNESGEKKAVELMPIINTWVSSLKGDDKSYAKKMFGKINQIEADDTKKKEILKYSILAFEKLRYTNKLSAIDNINIESFESIKNVFLGLDELEATMYYQIVKERIEVIKKFQKITDDNMREKIIQEYLFDHLWLLDPSWERVDGDTYMEKTVLKALNIVFDGLSQAEKDARLDIGYKTTAGKHIIVELKRVDRIVSLGELIQQVSKYSDALTKVLSQAGNSNFAYEIICVIGRDVDNNDSIAHRKQVAESLKPWNARVVYYTELIDNACKAYDAYLKENIKTQTLIEMFHQIEGEIC